MILCTALLLMGTQYATAQATNRAAAVKIEWRNRCQEPDSQAFFSVTVSAQGEVQYQGLKDVRQLGPRRATIARAQAKAILARAREMAADVGSRAPDPQQAGGECLRIQMQSVDDAAVEISSAAESAKALDALLKQSIRIQDWICPARKSVPMRNVNCGEPVVSYTLTEKHACLQPHVTDIYVDGSAHYYVVQSEPPDLYSRIAPSQITALAQLPADASAEETVVPGVTSRFFYLTGARAIEYSDRLQQATGFELKTLPTGGTCDYGKEFPVGRLTLPR